MNILWRPVPGYTRLDHEGVPRMSGNLCTAWLWKPGRWSPFGGAKGYCPCLCPTVLLKSLNRGPMSERGHALVLAWVLQVWGTIVGYSMFCSWGRPPQTSTGPPRRRSRELSRIHHPWCRLALFLVASGCPRRGAWGPGPVVVVVWGCHPGPPRLSDRCRGAVCLYPGDPPWVVWSM